MDILESDEEKHPNAVHYFNGKELQGFIFLKWKDDTSFDEMLRENGFETSTAFEIGDDNFLIFKLYERDKEIGKGEEVLITVDVFATYRMVLCDNMFHGMDFISKYTQLIDLTYKVIKIQDKERDKRLNRL